MTIANRSISNNYYRYGFQGQEKDNEIYGEGNAYTTTFRLYDSRLGIWKSPDPLQNYFAPFSPYNHVLNNPILWIDPEGLEPRKPSKPGGRNVFQKVFNRTSTGLKLVKVEKITKIVTFEQKNYLRHGGQLTKNDYEKKLNINHTFTYAYNKSISAVGLIFNSKNEGINVYRPKFGFPNKEKNVWQPHTLENLEMPLVKNRRVFLPLSKNGFRINFVYQYPPTPIFTEPQARSIKDGTITESFSFSAIYLESLYYKRKVKMTATQKYFDNLEKNGIIKIND